MKKWVITFLLASSWVMNSYAQDEDLYSILSPPIKPSTSSGIVVLNEPIDHYLIHSQENPFSFEVESIDSPGWENRGGGPIHRWTTGYGTHFKKRDLLAHCHQVESLINFRHTPPPVLPQRQTIFVAAAFDSSRSQITLAKTQHGYAIYGLIQESGEEGKVLLVSTENAIDPTTLVKPSWEKHTEYKNYQEGNTRITLESIPNDAWIENKIAVTPLFHHQWKVVLTRSEVFYDRGVIDSGAWKKETGRYALHEWNWICAGTQSESL